MKRFERWSIAVLLHAAENASNEPIDEEGLAVILRGTGGSGSHLRAVFGDGSLQAIADAAALLDIPLATVLASYAAARSSAAAANRELDLLLEEQQRYIGADRAGGKTSVDEEGGDPERPDSGLPASGRDAAHGQKPGG